MASQLHVLFDVSLDYIDFIEMASRQYVFFGVSQDQICLRNSCYIDYIKIASQQYAFFDVDYVLILEAWH